MNKPKYLKSIKPLNADRGPLMGRHRNIEILRVHRSDSENLQTESRNADRSPWVRAASSEARKHRSRWDRDVAGAGPFLDIRAWPLVGAPRAAGSNQLYS